MINLVTIPNYRAPEEYQMQYELHKTRQYQNLEDARTIGVDVNVRYAFSDFAVGGSYSYLDTKAHEYDSDHERMHEVVIDGMAHHKGSCFATWNHAFTSNNKSSNSKSGYRLGVGIYGRASSKRYYQLNGNGKAYHIWRLSTTHDFDCHAIRSRGLTLRAEAGVDNIFNYIDRTPHGLHLGTTSPGTTVYASLTIRFNQGKTKFQSFKTNSKQTYNEED